MNPTKRFDLNEVKLNTILIDSLPTDYFLLHTHFFNHQTRRALNLKLASIRPPTPLLTEQVNAAALSYRRTQ